MNCPRCNAHFANIEVTPWGEQPSTLTPMLPFICSACAGLLLLDHKTGELYIPPPKAIDEMKGNTELWQAIVSGQRAVRATRN